MQTQSGTNDFTVDAGALQAATNLNGGDGSDTFTVTGTLAVGGTLNIDGGVPFPDTDTLNVPGGSTVSPKPTTFSCVLSASSTSGPSSGSAAASCG